MLREHGDEHSSNEAPDRYGLAMAGFYMYCRLNQKQLSEYCSNLPTKSH
jgi:hypothetical protein